MEVVGYLILIVSMCDIYTATFTTKKYCGKNPRVSHKYFSFTYDQLIISARFS